MSLIKESLLFTRHGVVSGLAIDQAHKQANAVVKGDGGANGVTKNPSALRRWMVSGPESSWSVNQYELPFQVKRAIKDTMPKMTDMLGWVKNVDVRQALWKSRPPIATCRSCEHLTKCGCKPNANPNVNLISSP